MTINDYLGEKAQASQKSSQRGISRRGFLAGLGAVVAGTYTPSTSYSAETDKVPGYEEYSRAYMEVFGKDEFEKYEKDIKEEWDTSDSKKKSAIYSYAKYAKAYSNVFGKEEFKKKNNELVEKWMKENPKRRQKAYDYLVELSNLKEPSYNDFKKALGDRYNTKNDTSTKRFWENQDIKSKKMIYLVYTKPEQASSFYFNEKEENKVRKLDMPESEVAEYEKFFDNFGLWKVRLNKGDNSSNLGFKLFLKNAADRGASAVGIGSGFY